MAQKFGLFNAVGGSPSYNDVDLAEMLSLIIGSAGYVVGYKRELEVTAGAGFQAIIDTGGAWLGDPAGWWYINDETLTLDIDAEVEGYSRIDRVVLRLDRNLEALSITVQVLKGTAAASGPVAPALTQNSTVYEVSLAKALVTGGTTTIAITDERGSTYCGRIVLNANADGIEKTASFTLNYNNIGKIVKCNSTSAISIIIPSNATIPFEIGTEIAFFRYGTGTVVFAAASGVTLISPNSATQIAIQYGACALRKINTDVWLLSGTISQG